MSKESIFNRFWRNNCPQTQLSADFLVNVIDKAMDEYAQEQVKNLTIPVVMPSLLDLDFKQMRKAKGLTLREVEKSTGISNAYLSQLETGKIKSPGYDTVKALYELYSNEA